MISRRNLIKTLGLSAFTLPSLTGLSATRIKDDTLLNPDDPDFWKSVRNQFPLDKNTVFFNPGTVGAMPTVVVDKMTEHLKYIASNAADWAYKDDNKEEFISGYNNLMSIRAKV